jgi:hypothetical protein
MNPALAAVAIVTIGGAILAVTARDVRTTLLGLLLVLLGAPLVADPWPGPLAILIRIAASLLAVRLIAIGLRGDIATSGSRIGWPAEVLLAAAAAVVGFGSHGLGAVGIGPAAAQGAGFALIVLAAAPLFTGRDALRVAVGAVLVLVAASLIRSGLDRAPTDAEQLVEAILTIALGGAVAVIVSAARAAGGLDAIDDGGPGRSGGLGGAGRRLPDAHRPTARETLGRSPDPATDERVPSPAAHGPAPRRAPTPRGAAPRRAASPGPPEDAS